MKTCYLSLGIIQLLLISLSGWLRHRAWDEIDACCAAWSLDLWLSMGLLACWLATIVIAIGFALIDKTNRSMLVLFLVLLLPWMEFFVWLVLSF